MSSRQYFSDLDDEIMLTKNMSVGLKKTLPVSDYTGMILCVDDLLAILYTE